MSTTLVKGKYVLCGVKNKDSVEVISDGAVFQRDGLIVEVGKHINLRNKYAFSEEIGSDRFLVMPGLINAHQHGRGSTFIRGIPDGNLESWILKPMTRKPVDRYYDTLYCIARLIESGVTTVVHHQTPVSPNYGEMVNGILRAYHDGGIRVAFALGIKNQNDVVYSDNQNFLDSLPRSLSERVGKYRAEARVSEDEYFELFANLHKEYGTDSRIKILHGPNGFQWCSEGLLKRIKQSAIENHTGIHMHLLETVFQRMYALETFGKTAVEYMDEIGFLGPELSCAHCVWATMNDIKLLSKNRVSICHNPSSNLRLKSGIAPVNQMLENGMNVALGMDSTAINDDDDMLQELRLCSYLQRTPGWERSSPSTGQLLKMATVNGANVTPFVGEVGTLEKGKRADIILVDVKNINEPYLDSEIGIVDALVARGKGRDVDTVMIDGEIVMRDRELTRINRNEIISRLRESYGRATSDEKLRILVHDVLPYVSDFYQERDKSGKIPDYTYNCLDQ